MATSRELTFGAEVNSVANINTVDTKEPLVTRADVELFSKIQALLCS